jgi:hypothetical protein
MPLLYNSPDFPVCQRSNGYSATVDSNGNLKSATARGYCAQSLSRHQKVHQTVNSTCPVHHRTVWWPRLSELQRSNLTVGWRGWRTGQCPVAHRTVRCANRQIASPTAILVVGAINTPPTTTLQGIQVFNHCIQYKSSRLHSKTHTRDQILSQVRNHSKHLVASEREIFVFIWVLVAWIAFLLPPFLFSSNL